VYKRQMIKKQAWVSELTVTISAQVKRKTRIPA